MTLRSQSALNKTTFTLDGSPRLRRRQDRDEILTLIDKALEILEDQDDEQGAPKEEDLTHIDKTLEILEDRDDEQGAPKEEDE